MKTMRWRFVVLTVALAGTLAARAGEVQVAVAANFAGPLGRMAQGFSSATGHAIKLSSGATGKFYAQIRSGAPFDVLLAADDETPKKLLHEGHAVAGTQFTYAIGKLVLWSARPGFVDAEGRVLSGQGFAHLAIANPKVAPYGAAALEVLAARGLRDAVAPRVVTAESIAQAFQFVATGNAELGFVALSQVIGAEGPEAGPAAGSLERLRAAPSGIRPSGSRAGSWWLVPPSLYGPIRQDAVLLEAGRNNPAARALLAWLKTAPARAVIEAHGYGPDLP
jgi:molybdate transport system substrate-binding protein